MNVIDPNLKCYFCNRSQSSSVSLILIPVVLNSESALEEDQTFSGQRPCVLLTKIKRQITFLSNI